jgi:hypothetical protein
MECAGLQSGWQNKSYCNCPDIASNDRSIRYSDIKRCNPGPGQYRSRASTIVRAVENDERNSL